MNAHPNTLGLLDRAKRLIDESNPLDESPLTTASRDIREARAAVAELIEAGRAAVEIRLHDGTSAREACERLEAALVRVGGT